MREVRVREMHYIWGSAGIVENIHFHSPLLIHLINDAYGEVITIGTEQADGSRVMIGSLQPGETVSISAQDIRGVFITCKGVSSVWYAVKGLP
jgi:hypothetical protein